jgi:hypothetical protein
MLHASCGSEGCSSPPNPHPQFEKFINYANNLFFTIAYHQLNILFLFLRLLLSLYYSLSIKILFFPGTAINVTEKAKL